MSRTRTRLYVLFNHPSRRDTRLEVIGSEAARRAIYDWLSGLPSICHGTNIDVFDADRHDENVRQIALLERTSTRLQ